MVLREREEVPYSSRYARGPNLTSFINNRQQPTDGNQVGGKALGMGVKALGSSIPAHQDRCLTSHGLIRPSTERDRHHGPNQAQPSPRSTPQPQYPPSKAGEALPSPRQGDSAPRWVPQGDGCMGSFSVLKRLPRCRPPPSRQLPASSFLYLLFFRFRYLSHARIHHAHYLCCFYFPLDGFNLSLLLAISEVQGNRVSVNTLASCVLA